MKKMKKHEKKDIEPDLRRSIKRAVAIFGHKSDFENFLGNEDFLKRISALSYVEPFEGSQGQVKAHLYFRIPDRLKTLENKFQSVMFRLDESPRVRKYNGGNRLSKTIRNLQFKYGDLESLEIVKDMSVQTNFQVELKAAEPSPLVHEIPSLDESEIFMDEKPISKKNSKPIQSEYSYQKVVEMLQSMLPFMPANEVIKQDLLEKLTGILNHMLPLVPSKELLKLVPEIKAMEDTHQVSEDGISHFLRKSSEPSITFPILVREEDGPIERNRMDVEIEKEEEKTMFEKADSRECLDANPNPNPNPNPNQKQLPRPKPAPINLSAHPVSNKIDSRLSIFDQIKLAMEIQHLRFEDLEDKIRKRKNKNKHKDENQDQDQDQDQFSSQLWKNTIRDKKKELQDWEKILEKSHIYKYNDPNLSKDDQIGWNSNLDMAMELSTTTFEIRDIFRKASSHWYVFFLIQFWAESGLTMEEVVNLIKSKVMQRRNDGLETWYADELILLFEYMKSYLKKGKVQFIKKAFQHSDSAQTQDLNLKINSLFNAYTRKEKETI